MGNGFDTASPLTQETINAAKELNYTYVVRYYTTYLTSWKIMKPTEAQLISDSGIYVIAVFQDTNNRAIYFSETLGANNALSAYDYAMSHIKQPPNTPIYFAVDYDASDSEVKGCITNYFTEIKNKFTWFGNKYKVGVYGSGATCKHIKDTMNLAEYSWLAGATGYRGYKEYFQGNTWNMIQKQIIKINGVECTRGESSILGGGGWRL